MSVIFIQQTIIFECCMCHSLLASFVFYISPCQKKTSLLLLWIFIVGQDPELQWLMALSIGWCSAYYLRSQNQNKLLVKECGNYCCGVESVMGSELLTMLHHYSN